ncbi:hypothetical protein SDC9_119518 [bioreactor metagenome]|uniref:Uncharacterized protein n=1 Tax=bioreactor metagenome TaxID=1076179 RepID=A0A645C4G7_9ZZZZ
MYTYQLNEVYGISRDVPLNYIERDSVDKKLLNNLHQNLYILGIRHDALHSGETESHRLAGSGLGASQDIGASADQRDGLA